MELRNGSYMMVVSSGRREGRRVPSVRLISAERERKRENKRPGASGWWGGHWPLATRVK